ncbi:MAG TPA: ATP-dependent DNA helicase, partial [Verrucomicrobiae bacterium]|nr:ATP-dependent DNA helicase [Verrucomicrobiae bacterium]
MTQSVSTGRPRALFVSVREMVEFVLRTGNLGGERDFFSPSRALEGTRGHQKIQNLRPPGYQPEVRVKHQLHQPEFVLTIRGRIDGVLETPDGLLIEEIKTVLGEWSKTVDPLHWAQAKIYAFIYADDHDSPKRIEILLSYLDLDSGASTEFRETFTLDALREFFNTVASVYLQWASRQHEWMKLRDSTITALTFPHGQYRPGQRSLAV